MKPLPHALAALFVLLPLQAFAQDASTTTASDTTASDTMPSEPMAATPETMPATDESVEAPTPTAAAAATIADDRVTRSQFTTAILDREPTDDLSVIGDEMNKVFFFTEFRNMEGTTATHRWIYGGEVKAEVSFRIRAPRWRVYSSKNLLPEWVGDWTVEVLDESGNVLQSKTIGHGAG